MHSLLFLLLTCLSICWQLTFVIQTVNTYIPIEPAAIFLQGVFTQLVNLGDKRHWVTIGESINYNLRISARFDTKTFAGIKRSTYPISFSDQILSGVITYLHLWGEILKW